MGEQGRAGEVGPGTGSGRVGGAGSPATAASAARPGRRLVPAGRIVGLDVARALALVGMIATHMLPSTDPDGGVAVAQQVAGGRASALFAVLAGVSLALMSGRSTPVRGTEAWAVSAGLAVRALLIAVLGLLLGSLPSGILVILAYYGVLFLLGIPFIRLGAGSLALLAVVWVAVVPVLLQLLRPHLPEAPIASPTLGSLADPLGLLAQLTVTGTYHAIPWLAYLFVGMALGRLDLGRPDRDGSGWHRWRPARDLVLLGAGLALVSWSVSRVLLARPGVRERLEETLTGPYAGNLPFALDHGLYGTTPTGTWWWLAVDTPHTATPVDLAATIGSALLVIGISLAVGTALPRAASIAFGAGAMTLSLYTCHLVLRTPELLPDQNAGTFFAHVAIVLLIGAAYRLEGRSGPLERAVTSAARRTTDRFR